MNETTRHTLSVLVENTAGVLSQVSRLFSRKGYNIDSLAVGTTDDGDCCCCFSVESKEDCKEVSHIDTELCCSTHQEALRVRDQRTKVCHSTYTHKDKGRKNTPLIKDVEVMKKTTNTVGHVFRICHNVRININKEHTKCNGNKQKRLKSLCNGKI